METKIITKRVSERIIEGVKDMGRLGSPCIDTSFDLRVMSQDIGIISGIIMMYLETLVRTLILRVRLCGNTIGYYGAKHSPMGNGWN